MIMFGVVSCTGDVSSQGHIVTAASNLVSDADVILAKSNISVTIVPPKDWPASFSNLAPQNVRIGTNGVYISLKKRFTEERGVFILKNGSNFRPEENSDPSYKKIGVRVWSYHIKG